MADASTVDLRFWHASALVEAYRLHNPGVGVEEMAMALGFRDFPGLSAALFLNKNFLLLWILPAFFTSIWLWLYAGSGFLLKAARRFDMGFDWFNRKFDIEKKPLQSIGLVAGALVAVTYWTVALIHHFI
jgi:hypothetical protein